MNEFSLFSFFCTVSDINGSLFGADLLWSLFSLSFSPFLSTNVFAGAARRHVRLNPPRLCVKVFICVIFLIVVEKLQISGLKCEEREGLVC